MWVHVRWTGNEGVPWNQLIEFDTLYLVTIQAGSQVLSMDCGSWLFCNSIRSQLRLGSQATKLLVGDAVAAPLVKERERHVHCRTDTDEHVRLQAPRDSLFLAVWLKANRAVAALQLTPVAGHCGGQLGYLNLP